MESGSRDDEDEVAGAESPAAIGGPRSGSEAGERSGEFPATQWTMVIAAGAEPSGRMRALEALCANYWPPVYAFIRSRGFSPEDAEDLTQEFLAYLMERNDFGKLSSENGRFRSFLLRALKNFIANEWNRRNARKRGGGIVHISIDRGLGESWFLQDRGGERDPEAAFERRWAVGVIESALARVEDSYRHEGKLELYEALSPLLSGDDARGIVADVAASLGISDGNARVALHRLRLRVRQALENVIADTVIDPMDVDAEIKHLFGIFGGA